MLIERDIVPAFSIHLYCKSLPSTALLSCTLVQKELDTHVRSSKGKTMPRMYLQQDSLKIIFCINEAVWLLEVPFKTDFTFKNATFSLVECNPPLC